VKKLEKACGFDGVRDGKFLLENIDFEVFEIYSFNNILLRFIGQKWKGMFEK
jgi:hypothetical protein